jgi:hypothetical protein
VVSANTAVRKTDPNGSIRHFDHICSNRSPKNRHFSSPLRELLLPSFLPLPTAAHDLWIYYTKVCALCQETLARTAAYPYGPFSARSRQIPETRKRSDHPQRSPPQVVLLSDHGFQSSPLFSR